jgi:outer membrane protein OmpA-like peptidoglycan-associated protein
VDWRLSSDARLPWQAATVMDEYDAMAIIAGHTDSTGTEEHNQALSERRARSVVGELASRGVDQDRIANMGFGESQPVADNASSEGRRRNRRVDVMLRAKAR